jgi:hypothetical protein
MAGIVDQCAYAVRALANNSGTQGSRFWYAPLVRVCSPPCRELPATRCDTLHALRPRPVVHAGAERAHCLLLSGAGAASLCTLTCAPGTRVVLEQHLTSVSCQAWNQPRHMRVTPAPVWRPTPEAA